MWKTAQRFRGKYFPQIFAKNMAFEGKKHEHGGYEKRNYAQRPIRPRSSRDFKTTLLTDVSFMVQISPKYFHSLEPRIIFWGRFFFIKLWTRPKYFFCNFLLQYVETATHSGAAVASIQLFSKYKSKERNFQIFNINIDILRKWGRRDSFVKDSFSMAIDP